ncbi:quaternary amine ABC transporter ATP-binding protein [Nocardioides terrisoli]|uniref:quaternary amine ABC transporter ATP-binding protein n=1 Tax=Nocardioides terrisoli TaxID=3388267 RepID=UPI00287B952D|nr:glycine betaine/L-proline ABC transporter ATP-binding protein [Nocardioides marmorisolisilvae]
MPAIEARHLYKIFGRRGRDGVDRLEAGASTEDLRSSGLTAAVIDASFTVEEGEIFVVMGLSGSGKSTLIRMVNGLHEPTSGHVEVYGDNLTAMKPAQLRAARRDKISMVFQHFALLPHRSVVENAAYGLEIKGVPKDERRERASRALEMCGLKGWDDYRPDELSGGMRQRVGLARALAADTPVLLMDEAFSALDPLIRREMQDQLIELQHELGKTILFITHDLNEAMRLGDRIAMMRDGRIVQIGTAEEILTDPANDYVARFVADVDRTRVLTASSVMEPPVAVLGSEQGPRVAHRLMREHQQRGLYVTSRSRELIGYVMEHRVAGDLDAQTIKPVTEPITMAVPADTPLSELFTPSAETLLPLPVVDGDRRLLGVIPRVTLLSALGEQTEPSDRTGADDAPTDSTPEETAHV